MLSLASATALDAAQSMVPTPELPKLEISFEPATAITVGDRVQAFVTVVLPPGSRTLPIFPQWGSTWGAAEVLSVGPPVELPLPPGGRGIRPRRVRQILTLTVFETGRHGLPQRQVRVPLIAGDRLLTTSDGLVLTVRSVLPPPEAGETVEPLAHRPPRTLPLGTAFGLTVLALVCALVLALGLLLARRPHADAAVAGIDPQTAFRRLLDALDQERNPGGRATLLHGRLAVGLRHYLGHRFGFDGGSATTSETLHQLGELALASGFREQVGTVLQDSDGVRFAGDPCEEAPWRARLQSARRLLRRGEEEYVAWLARTLELRRQARLEVHQRRQERLLQRRPEDRRPWEANPEDLSVEDRHLLRSREEDVAALPLPGPFAPPPLDAGTQTDTTAGTRSAEASAPAGSSASSQGSGEAGEQR
ncbi:MAG: hypothetical protein AAGD01_19765 [Acidobacteriota bacterium]